MLLSVGEGMRLYLCIAQVALKGSSRKVCYIYMYMYMYFMHDVMVMTYLYNDMHSMSPIVYI